MSDKLLMKGNEALAEAAIIAGCRFFFGYPITPQTEVAAYMAKRMPKIGGTFLQSESELAAINMVIGAASAGARAMTSSSSPGVSLKSEGISFLAAMDIPALIINVQRGGPGLGGIQPAQGDYYQATRSIGHGDFHTLVFAPSTVQEVVSLVIDAFDMADKYRIPAMMLADGILGQMMEPVSFPEPLRELPSKPWATNGTKGLRKKNILNSLYLKPDELEEINFIRYQKYAEIEKNEQRYEEFMADDAEYMIVAFGAAARIAKNAIRAAREKGIKVGLIRPIQDNQPGLSGADGVNVRIPAGHRNPGVNELHHNVHVLQIGLHLAPGFGHVAGIPLDVHAVPPRQQGIEAAPARAGTASVMLSIP